MSLTFNQRVVTQEEKVEYKERELRSPKDWAMFTSKGNRSLQKKGELLILKLEKTKTDRQCINALLSYLRSYRRMEKSKTMSEAGDTAVRECIWDFFEKACICIGLSNMADALWDSNDAYPN